MLNRLLSRTSREAFRYNLKDRIFIQKRFAGDGYWGYREPNYRPDFGKSVLFANVVGSFAWWWVFWHLFTDYGHVIGEFEYYNPEKDFSDRELGVPSDEEGLAPTIPNPRTTRIAGNAMTGRGPQRPQNYSPHALQKFYGDTGCFKF